MTTKNKYTYKSKPFDDEYFKLKIVEGSRNIDKNIKHNDVVLVIGATGSGKSTLINYLIGNKIGIKAGFQVRAEPELVGEGYPVVGHSDLSQTIYPESFQDRESGIFYCDCPGFFDNRSIEDKLSIGINTQAAIMSAKSIRGVIICITYLSLIEAKARLVNELMVILKNFFVDLDSILPSVVFVFTKLNSDVTESMLIEFLEEKLEQSSSMFSKVKAFVSSKRKKVDKESEEVALYCQLFASILKNKNNIVIGDLSNTNCRNRIINIFNEIDTQIDKKSFKFDILDTEKKYFDEFMYNFSHSSIKHLRRVAYYAESKNDFEYKKRVTSDDISFFTAELKRLKSLDPTIKEECSSKYDELETEIESLSELLKSEQKKLSHLSNKHKSVVNDLSILENDELICYKSLYCYDKLSFFSLRNNSKKIFIYDDIPFEKIEKLAANGSFETELYDPKSGKFNIIYRSAKGKDGIAQIKIFVKKCDFPDNKRQIHDKLENVLPKLLDDVKKISQNIEKTSETMAYLKENKDKLRGILEEYEKQGQISYMEKNLKVQKKYLDQLIEKEVKFKKLSDEGMEFIRANRNLIETLRLIRDSISFKSGLVDKFFEKYNYIKAIEMIDDYEKNIEKVDQEAHERDDEGKDAIGSFVDEKRLSVMNTEADSTDPKDDVSDDQSESNGKSDSTELIMPATESPKNILTTFKRPGKPRNKPVNKPPNQADLIIDEEIKKSESSEDSVQETEEKPASRPKLQKSETVSSEDSENNNHKPKSVKDLIDQFKKTGIHGKKITDKQKKYMIPIPGASFDMNDSNPTSPFSLKSENSIQSDDDDDDSNNGNIESFFGSGFS